MNSLLLLSGVFLLCSFIVLDKMGADTPATFMLLLAVIVVVVWVSRM